MIIPNTKTPATPSNRLVNNNELYNNNNNNSPSQPEAPPPTLNNSINASNLIEINTSTSNNKTQKICITKTLPPLPLPDVDPNDFMDSSTTSSSAASIA